MKPPMGFMPRIRLVSALFLFGFATCPALFAEVGLLALELHRLAADERTPVGLVFKVVLPAAAPLGFALTATLRGPATTPLRRAAAASFAPAATACLLYTSDAADEL